VTVNERLTFVQLYNRSVVRRIVINLILVAIVLSFSYWIFLQEDRKDFVDQLDVKISHNINRQLMVLDQRITHIIYSKAFIEISNANGNAIPINLGISSAADFDYVFIVGLSGEYCRFINISINVDHNYACIDSILRHKTNHWGIHRFDENIVLTTARLIMDGNKVTGKAIFGYSLNSHPSNIRKLVGNSGVIKKLGISLLEHDSERLGIERQGPLVLMKKLLEDEPMSPMMNITLKKEFLNKLSSLSDPITYVFIWFGIFFLGLLSHVSDYYRNLKNVLGVDQFLNSNYLDVQKGSPTEIYRLHAHIGNLERRLTNKEASLRSMTYKLNLHKNMMQKEYSQRMTFFKRCKSETNFKEEQTAKNISNTIKHKVSAVHLKLDTINDELVKLEAPYESHDMVDDANNIVSEISDELLSHVQAINPFMLSAMSIGEKIKLSDILPLLRNKGCVVRISYDEDRLSTERKKIAYEVIYDTLTMVLEKAKFPLLIDIDIKSQTSGIAVFLSSKIGDVDPVIHENLYEIEFIKAKADTIGLVPDMQFNPDFQMKLDIFDKDLNEGILLDDQSI
jgi:hypothetical protein